MHTGEALDVAHGERLRRALLVIRLPGTHQKATKKMKQDGMSKETMGKDAMSKDSMGKDSMGKDGMKQ